jgi:hypothetical protein
VLKFFSFDSPLTRTYIFWWDICGLFNIINSHLFNSDLVCKLKNLLKWKLVIHKNNYREIQWMYKSMIFFVMVGFMALMIFSREVSYTNASRTQVREEIWITSLNVIIIVIIIAHIIYLLFLIIRCLMIDKVQDD